MSLKNLKLGKMALIIAIAVCVFSCKKSDTTTTTNLEVPAVYKKIYGAVSITNDGTYLYIKTKDLPDHKSVYYPSTNALYESYSGTTFGGNTFVKNPNSILEQTGTF